MPLESIHPVVSSFQYANKLINGKNLAERVDLDMENSPEHFMSAEPINYEKDVTCRIAVPVVSPVTLPVYPVTVTKSF